MLVCFGRTCQILEDLNALASNLFCWQSIHRNIRTRRKMNALKIIDEKPLLGEQS
jgi:hypothetical protein